MNEKLLQINDALYLLAGELGARDSFENGQEYDDALDQATHVVAGLLRVNE